MTLDSPPEAPGGRGGMAFERIIKNQQDLAEGFFGASFAVAFELFVIWSNRLVTLWPFLTLIKLLEDKPLLKVQLRPPRTNAQETSHSPEQEPLSGSTLHTCCRLSELRWVAALNIRTTKHDWLFRCASCWIDFSLDH